MRYIFVLVWVVGCAAAGTQDAGARSTCGNGTLETDERCEGFDLRGATCVSEGFEMGELRCSASCALDKSGCSKCGDGVISGLEVCDTNSLANEQPVFGSKTCATEVDAGAEGTLVCGAACRAIITSACTFPTALPQRGEPCSMSRGCAATFVCDVVSASPVQLRCRLRCAASGIGTGQGCPGGELCADGGIEFEGQPPVACSTGCSAGYGCVDAGQGLAFCARAIGACQ